jgi:osmotically inducible protein OsmC
VTWASRTGRADGKTSPEELAAAAHSACYAMALRLGEHKAAPQRLAVDATVTLDEAGGVLRWDGQLTASTVVGRAWSPRPWQG